LTAATAVPTLTKLEAYANENFREDYLRLPAVKIERVKSDYTKLRIEDQVDITVSPQKNLHFNPDQLRQLKPFCWVNVSFEQYQKMDALLTYYVLVKYNDIARIRSSWFTDDFRSACADVANGLRAAEAAEAAVDDSSDLGITVAGLSQGQKANRTHHLPSPSNVLQRQDPIGENKNHIQERQNLLQDLMADYNALKQQASTFKGKFTALENRISTLELASANEDLKAKLAIAEAQVVKLAKENVELHEKLAAWFGFEGGALKKGNGSV
jgi:hypothetical protein